MDGELSLFTLEALATLSGASFLTYLIVAYTKQLVQQWLKIPTDLYAWIIGSVVLLLAGFATGGRPTDWTIWFLSVVNGFVVAATAGRMNDKALSTQPSQNDAGR